MLRGIDVSSWQAGIDIGSIDCDFAIVKCTGGGYVNPCWRDQARATLDSGKLLGLYHFANDVGWGAPEDEAEQFLAQAEEFRGKYIPVLDWEGEALSNPVSWARTWLDVVAERTGATPWFYSYSNYINNTDCSQVAMYPLWLAAYYNGYAPMGWQDDPPIYGGTGAWQRATAYQYTSTGRVGYGGNLDLSVFYGTREDWLGMEGKMATNADMVDLLMPISTRYVFGGSRYEPYDTDCSGMVCAAFYKVHGVDPYTLGDWTGAQWSRGVLSKLWWGTTPNLPWDRMQKGDVIFTSNCSVDFSTGNGSHVGFYTGDPGAPFLSHFADGGPYVTAVNGVYGNECYFGVARYMEGADDMQPANVWEYNYNNSAVGGNMYNAVNGTAQAILEPHESSAGDGTSGSMRDRIEWMDMRIREMHDQIGKLSTGSVDYDKLAKAVADELHKRMAQ